jgi:hypothetical protein
VRRQIQKPVFNRKEVEAFVKRTFASPPRGYRVGYQRLYNEPRQFLGYTHGIVRSLDEIDWSRVRRITVLFPEGVDSTRLVDGDEAIRDGIRLNVRLLRRRRR